MPDADFSIQWLRHRRNGRGKLCSYRLRFKIWCSDANDGYGPSESYAGAALSMYQSPCLYNRVQQYRLDPINKSGTSVISTLLSTC